MTRCTFQQTGSVLVKFKVCQCIRRLFPYQCGCYQLDVFLFSKCNVILPIICTIRNQNAFFFRSFHCGKVFLKKMAVRMRIFIKLIVCYYRTIPANCFFYVSRVASVLFSGFISVGCIRVRMNSCYRLPWFSAAVFHSRQLSARKYI